MARDREHLKLEDKGGQRLRRKLANPAYAARITQIREGMRAMEQPRAAGTDESGTPPHDHAE